MVDGEFHNHNIIFSILRDDTVARSLRYKMLQARKKKVERFNSCLSSMPFRVHFAVGTCRWEMTLIRRDKGARGLHSFIIKFNNINFASYSATSE